MIRHSIQMMMNLILENNNNIKGEKKMKLKKIALIIAAAMTVTSFAGCANNKKTDNSGKIKLNWVMPGPGMQKDSEEVFKALSDKLKNYEGFENVDLDITVYPASDYQKKFLLLQTSKADMDMIQTYSLKATEEIRNGSFIPLDDYIKNSHQLDGAFPDWLWDYAKVDGKTWFVPNYQLLANVDYSFATQKSLADKYWNVEEAQAKFCAADTFDESCWDVLEDYLSTLDKNGEIRKGWMPLDSLTFTLQKGYENVGERFLVKADDPEHKLVYMDEMPERIHGFHRISDFFKKGYIRKDIASLGGSDSDYGNENGYVLWHMSTRMNEDLTKVMIDNFENKYGFDVVTAKTKDYDFIPECNAAGGNAISIASKNPDKAWEFLALMNSEEGKELYNMVVYGIEGKHYKVVDDSTVEPIGYIGQASSSANYGLWKWVVGNSKYAYNLPGETMTPEILDEVNTGEHSVRSQMTGLVLDTSSLTTEIAQINTVFEEYKGLNLGIYGDVDKTYKEYMNKVKTAGLEKVRAELQKQVDEFFKNKK